MTTNTKYPCGSITDVIIRAYYQTLNTLGSIRGTPASAFRKKLAVALKKEGLRVQLDQFIEVREGSQVIDVVRVEMVVGGLVVVCVKNVLHLTSMHFAEGTYKMEAGGYPAGLMLNYGAKERKPQRLTPPRKYYKGPWKCS
jgi:GxxExxY protein